MDHSLTDSNDAPASAAPSIVVDRLPRRTARPHGISGPELNRLSGAVRFMDLHGRLWWLHTNKAMARAAIADVQKRITRLQIEYGLRPYNLTVFEGQGGLHAHIVFTGDGEIVRRLKGSAAFGDFIKSARVTDSDGVVKYLAKARTPQAGWGREHLLGGRLPGSHRLDGGGDRVRLSRDLERDAIDANYVQSWQHKNARRSAARKPYSPRLKQRLRKTAPRPSGQAPLFPELERPVSRLRHFGSGFIPPAVAKEIEFRRQKRGEVHRVQMVCVGSTSVQLGDRHR
jgi:hypothetical protein